MARLTEKEREAIWAIVDEALMDDERDFGDKRGMTEKDAAKMMDRARNGICKIMGIPRRRPLTPA